MHFTIYAKCILVFLCQVFDINKQCNWRQETLWENILIDYVTQYMKRKKIYAVACLPSNKLSEMISDIVPQEDIVLTL